MQQDLLQSQFTPPINSRTTWTKGTWQDPVTYRISESYVLSPCPCTLSATKGWRQFNPDDWHVHLHQSLSDEGPGGICADEMLLHQRYSRFVFPKLRASPSWPFLALWPLKTLHTHLHIVSWLHKLLHVHDWGQFSLSKAHLYLSVTPGSNRGRIREVNSSG